MLISSLKTAFIFTLALIFAQCKAKTSQRTIASKASIKNSQAANLKASNEVNLYEKIRIEIDQARLALNHYVDSQEHNPSSEDINLRVATDVLTITADDMYQYYTSDSFDEVFFYMSLTQDAANLSTKDAKEATISTHDPYRYVFKEKHPLPQEQLQLTNVANETTFTEKIIESGYETITGEDDHTGGIVLIATGGLAVGMGAIRLGSTSNFSKGLGAVQLGVGLALLYAGQRIYQGDDSLKTQETVAYMQMAAGVITAFGAVYVAYEGIQYLESRKTLGIEKPSSPSKAAIPEAAKDEKVTAKIAIAISAIIPGLKESGAKIFGQTGNISDAKGSQIFGAAMLGAGAPILAAGALFSMYRASEKLDAIAAESSKTTNNSVLELTTKDNHQTSPRVWLKQAEQSLRKIIYLKRLIINQRKISLENNSTNLPDK